MSSPVAKMRSVVMKRYSEWAQLPNLHAITESVDSIRLTSPQQQEANFSLALRLLSGGHAAPLAIRTKEIPERKNFSICSTRDGGVDDGLRRRRRKRIRAPASASSIHHGIDFT
jgi:hypothetical protein